MKVIDLNLIRLIKELEQFNNELTKNYLLLEKRVILLQEKLTFLEKILVEKYDRSFEDGNKSR